MSKWYVYILKCSDGTLYTGITNNIKARIAKHNSGKGAKYTRGRMPVVLKRTFKYKNRSEASKAEYAIKQLSRVEKLKLTQLRRKVAMPQLISRSKAALLRRSKSR